MRCSSGPALKTAIALDMSVSDNGEGVPSTEIEQVFFAERQRVHALTLLRRRLRGMFGRFFKLEVHSKIGEGTTVTMRIPLRTQIHVAERAGPIGTCDQRLALTYNSMALKASCQASHRSCYATAFRYVPRSTRTAATKRFSPRAERTLALSPASPKRPPQSGP